ncbi:MAG: hypothetical protein M1834_004989 [Cirrosporium novae-zelandiae]|nr:MAG: hypothetical protein M1834_004989 [Cirrosporium novae-zelandiae]
MSNKPRRSSRGSIVFDPAHQIVRKGDFEEAANYMKVDIPTRWGDKFDIYVDRWSEGGPKFIMASDPTGIGGQDYLATINLHNIHKWKRVTKQVTTIAVIGEIPRITSQKGST